MIQGVAYVALLVREYDEAISFYCGKLGFLVAEDVQLEEKRWIRLRAPGGLGSEILLSKAMDEKQMEGIGNQAGGRVLFFMYSDNLKADYEKLRLTQIEFTEAPRKEAYGWIAV